MRRRGRGETHEEKGEEKLMRRRGEGWGDLCMRRRGRGETHEEKGERGNS